MDAATQLFGTKGYGATTAEDIARVAGSSRATFCLHFKSKSAVMVAMLERAWPDVESSAGEFARSVDKGLTTEDLRANIASEIGSWRSLPGVMAAVNVAILVDSEVAEWYYTNSTKAYDVLAGMTTGRKSRAKEDRRATIAVLGRMTLAAVDLDADRGAAATEHIVDYVTDLWARLLID